jgi:hypothetical protein
MVYGQQNNSKPPDLEHIRFLKSKVKSWKFQAKMPLTFQMLVADTKKKMKDDRQFGKLNPFSVPDDKRRNEKTETLVKEKGMENLAPIIMIKHPDGFELYEGWHRTMAAFRVHPDGFKVNAWIGTPP